MKAAQECFPPFQGGFFLCFTGGYSIISALSERAGDGSGEPRNRRKNGGEMMEKRTGIVRNPKKALSRIGKALPVIFFLFVFFLYWSLLSEPYFTDEEDVFFGAYNVIKGQDVYRAFLSQHMPFSYYFTALIALCGARTVYQFRLGIYVLLTAVWETAFLRHRKAFHPLTLFAVPLVYLTILRTLRMGTTMISDHWQGIGLVLVLLEVVRYLDRQEITLPCALMVCLGILLSLGTTFASAYPLFCFFLAMAWTQAKAVRRDRKAGDPAGRLKEKKYLKEDLRLAGICLLPFALLAGWYLISGNMANFFSGAYEIVTKVYSKYTGGLGSDPVSVVWGTVGEYGKYLVSAAQDLAGGVWPAALYLVSALGLVSFSVLLGRKSPAVGVLVFLAAVYGGLRGFDAFHGMAYHAQAAATLTLSAGMALERCGKLSRGPKWAARTGAAFAALLMLSPFVIWAGYNLLYPQILLPGTLRCEERILSLLTEPGETVFPCNAPVSSLDVMDLELVPKEACGAVTYPYFYEMWGDRQMASIRDHPHVVMYDGDESIWGYTFRDYAPDFEAYMQEHYTRLPQAETVWVSNDFLPEAEKRLKEAGYGSRWVSNVGEITANVPVKYFSGESVQGRFTAKEERLSAVRFCAACYRRRSDPTVRVLLREADTGTEIAETVITGEEIADNFFSRCPLRAELTPGREYEIEMTVERICGKGDMEFYYTPEGSLALGEEYDPDS